MSNVLPAGRYKCTVTSCSLREKGPNNLLCFSAYFRGDEGKDGDEYEPMEGDWGIIGDFYLERKDGSLNEDQVRKLAAVFEWNGDYNTLGTAATGARCKLTVKDDTYNGKTRPKADWLDHIDAGDSGFSLDWDAATAKKAQMKLAAKTKAVLGSPAAPRPVATRPATPPPSVQAKALNEASGATADSVWEAFEKKMQAENTPADHVETAWFEFLNDTAGTKDSAAVRDWAKVAVALPGWSYLPFP